MTSAPGQKMSFFSLWGIGAQVCLSTPTHKPSISTHKHIIFKIKVQLKIRNNIKREGSKRNREGHENNNNHVLGVKEILLRKQSAGSRIRNSYLSTKLNNAKLSTPVIRLRVCVLECWAEGQFTERLKEWITNEEAYAWLGKKRIS